MRIYIVKKSEENSSLLQYLQEKIPAAPQSYLRQLIKSRKVLHNGMPATSGTLICHGEKISLSESKNVRKFIEQSKNRPDILYESEAVIVVNKPSGLATHAGKGHEKDNLTSRVVDMMSSRKEPFMIAPVHRLDLHTSGPVIFGKGKKAISALGKLLEGDAVEKRYLALTESGILEKGPLTGNVTSKGKVKYAETGFRILQNRGGLTLLELDLKTGRQHQIRKQLSDKGFPIIGDKRYRGKNVAGLERLFLHCHSLSFTDPFAQQPIHISVPLPEELTRFLELNSLTTE